MKVNEILPLLRHCVVTFKYCSNDSIVASASIFFYGSGTSIDFYNLHISQSELLNLTVEDVYASARGVFNIYVS